MLYEVFTQWVVIAGLIGVLGIVTMALVAATQAALRLRWRVLMRGLTTLLYRAQSDMLSEDEDDDETKLWLRSIRDARTLLDSRSLERFTCSSGLMSATRRLLATRATWITAPELHTAIVENIPHLRDRATHIANGLKNIAPSMSRRYRNAVRLWTAFWAIVLVAAYDIVDALRLGNGADAVQSMQLDLVRGFSGAFGSGTLAEIAGVLIAAAFVGIAAHIAYRYFAVAASVGDSSATREDDHVEELVTEERPRPIGRDNCAVRAINFSGGGFDTFMQLGVTHALMVIQGRAPDTVVGLSAGAAQAAALAEVLQAGEEVERDGKRKSWGSANEEEKYDLQLRRQGARVKRFREFLNVCFQAREKIFDAILPDAYQIDSHDPLAPLQSPFFPDEERQQRLKSLGAKSGLIRIYNDLLGLNIPFGTIVRIIRRILGYREAGDIPHWFARQFVRVTELARIWLLLGQELPRAAHLVPLLLPPLVHWNKRAHPSTAGSLIFRFEILSLTWTYLKTTFWLIILLFFWLSASLLPVWIGVFFVKEFDGSPWMLAGMIYLIPFLVIVAATKIFDVSNFWYACRDTFRGSLAFMGLIIKWSAVLFLTLLVLFVLRSFFDSPFGGTVDDVWRWTGIAFVGAVHDVWRFMLVLNIFGPVFFFVIVIVIVISILSSQLFSFVKGRRKGYSILRWYLRRLLRSYRIADSLFHPHALQVFLADFFDEHYYGKVDLDSIVDESLKNLVTSSAEPEIRRKLIAHYSGADRVAPIHVGIAVADIATGNLEVIPDSVPVVDGLVAAMSAVPLFPAQEVAGRLYVDGTNVANVPTRALFSMLKNRVNKKSRTVHIYSVAPLPFSRLNLREPGDQRPIPYLRLIDIAQEALQLQRFRDAKLERIWIEIFTQVIPAKDVNNTNVNQITVDGEDGEENYIRAWVTPIELEKPISLNQRIILASGEERRKKIAETIADGCRAALETMITPSIRACSLRPHGSVTVCREAVHHHLASRSAAGNFGSKVANMTLPGSSPDAGPGLKEICAHCSLNHEKPEEYPQRLKVRKWKQEGPPWPHEQEIEDKDLEDDPHFVAETPFKKPNCPKNWGKELQHWPRKHDKQVLKERSTVSFLFSGGVFRGVFQMGVLNALNELRLTPDLVAGASVGSITAAMAARAFSMEKDQELEKVQEPAVRKPFKTPYRQRQIVRLAAIYLAMDRLILTDRFADFVRNLTIRASATRFSLRRLDYLFRRYDKPGFRKFDRGAREVLGGLEHLFYLNPYQLNELVRDLRNDKKEEAFDKLRGYVQKWLRRMGVEIEVLEAEPLRKLIENYVIPECYRDQPESAPFNAFKNSIRFLATTTNMTLGGLKILGMYTGEEKDESINLMEGLLASSAFPAVFRPRWSWELHPTSIEEEQFIDGGVTDNLPIDAVVNFLLAASNSDPKTIEGRPVKDKIGSPHLIFATSLEPLTERFKHPDEWAYLSGDWVALRKRTKELGYNTKLDLYAEAEQKLRKIYAEVLKRADGDSSKIKSLLTPIDAEILTVKPQWLCGTFAFHPMLGFRRKKQAQSIAHGCASTLLEFARTPKEYLESWGITMSQVPIVKTFGEAEAAWKKEAWKIEKWPERKHMCWLRQQEKVRCPFSEAALSELSGQLVRLGEKPIDPGTIKEVAKIHTYCVKPSTHRSQ